MPTERMFPIQCERVTDTSSRDQIYRSRGEVPWGIAALAYEQYAKHYGTSQSLERLAERGGFGWSELVSLLQGGDGRGMVPPSLGH